MAKVQKRSPGSRKINMRSNKCSKCGLCCRLFLINLTEKEYNSGKYKTQFENINFKDNFQKLASLGANILKTKADNSCIYLVENKCSIHKIRPQSCREFFCSSKSKKFGKMIAQIKQQTNFP